MRSFLFVGLFTTVVATTLAGQTLVRANEQGPKNLMALSARPAAQAASVTGDLTKRQVKRLLASREVTPAEHMRIAEYYKARAASFDAQGLAFERAAGNYRNRPSVKNLTAPSAVGQYEFIAKNLRERARLSRAAAASHEELAIAASL